MKAAVFKGPNKIRIENIPIPEPRDNEVQIKVHSTGICGTDLHLFKGYKVGTLSTPLNMVFGHEFGGVITKTGKSVPAVYKTGQRVVVEPNIGCGQCKTCLAGYYVQCEKGQSIIGIHRNGGFAEYAVVPHEKVFLLPDNISMKTASVLEPFAICVYGIINAPIIPGDTVLIMGPGVAGLHFTMLAKACGAAKVILSGPNQARLNLGRKLGADEIINVVDKDLLVEVMKETEGEGANYIFEAAGVQSTLANMTKTAANKAKICIYGIPVKPVDNIDFSEFLLKDLTLVAASGAQNTFKRAIKIVSSGIVNLENVITHTFPLDEIEKAFELVDKRLDGVAKASIMIDSNIK
ncbi:MAG: alcohol dehydrogenase catalytic domain-containing protein [Bacteroidetes bacterium]|nr:alcohol dehydrogenase catalytic domain-containing protein [Bacteroidota bacterium]